MNQKIIVDIWSDLICPWCWIGKRRFERALASFPHRDHVEIRYRSYRLMPCLAPLRGQEMLEQRLGSASRVAAMQAHVIAEAAKEGLEYHLADIHVGDTLDAHRLVKLATTKDLQEQAVERFYRAYFSEQASLFDRETLLRLMAEIGLDPDACAAMLNSTDHAAAVEDDQHMRQTHGGSGVPFFLIDGRLVASGAQSTPKLLAVLDLAWNSRQASSPASSAGSSCSLDGCAVPE